MITLILQPILRRGTPHPLFENTHEMLRVLESQFVSDLANRFSRVKHFFFGDTYQFQLDIFLCRFPRFLFNQIPEVIG